MQRQISELRGWGFDKLMLRNIIVAFLCISLGANIFQWRFTNKVQKEKEAIYDKLMASAGQAAASLEKCNAEKVEIVRKYGEMYLEMRLLAEKRGQKTKQK